MIDKGKIKIIKRIDAGKAAPQVEVIKSPRKAAREMVSTVTDWVSELKVRKGEETKAALELLFGANQRPSES